MRKALAYRVATATIDRVLEGVASKQPGGPQGAGGYMYLYSFL